MIPIPLEEPTKKDNEKLSIKKNNPKPLCKYTKEQQNRFLDEMQKLTLGEVSNKLEEMKGQFDLENKLMEMPELEEELIEFTEKEIAQMTEQEKFINGVIDKFGNSTKEELIHKRMNDINTFQCCEGELYLRGTDEYGKDFQICFDAYNFLEWIDTEQLEYIKEQLIKQIKTK